MKNNFSIDNYMITQWSYFFFNKTNSSKKFKNKADYDKRYNVSKTFSNYKDLFIENKIDYNYTGKLLNLGLINNNSNPILNKIIKYKFLRRYLKTQKFDFIIDNRSRPIFIKEFLIKNFLYNGNNIIYMAHSSLLKNYVPQSKFLARLLYKESKSIVAVSNHIKQNLESKYYFKRV